MNHDPLTEEERTVLEGCLETGKVILGSGTNPVAYSLMKRGFGYWCRDNHMALGFFSINKRGRGAVDV